jgi:uncharacterized membrane protein YoaK (UPF0700 family)
MGGAVPFVLPAAIRQTLIHLMDQGYTYTLAVGAAIATASSLVTFLFLLLAFIIGRAFAAAILQCLKRYSFNGALLAIGAVIFLTSRVLIMYDTWPHSSHAATVVTHEQAVPGGQSGQPAEQP